MRRDRCGRCAESGHFRRGLLLLLLKLIDVELSPGESYDRTFTGSFSIVHAATCIATRARDRFRDR